MVLGVLLCLFSASALAAAESQPSPSADVDLICHTSNPDECYPRVFQPTDEFQTVHEDQEIPLGLHVRMNIWSGKKEAKINVPEEADGSLEGLPVDQAIVVVEPEQADEPAIPKGAPEYETVGKIKEPEPHEQHEAHGFYEAMKILKAGGGVGQDTKAFDDALEGMEELSHDIYYGLKITEDAAVVKSLFCIMVEQGNNITSAEGEATVPRDQQAASILAGALQNNPTALQEIVKEWPAIKAAQCPGDDKTPLGQSFYSTFMSFGNPTSAEAKTLPSRAKAKVSAINGLIKSVELRKDFLSNDGMRRLLEVLIPEGKEWTTAQRKVGQLVLDTFLDEDMGAVTGQWPRVARLSDAQCRTIESQTEEGCWDYHVERIMRANKKDKSHWSRDLHDRLVALRKSGKVPPPHGEL